VELLSQRGEGEKCLGVFEFADFWTQAARLREVDRNDWQVSLEIAKKIMSELDLEINVPRTLWELIDEVRVFNAATYWRDSGQGSYR
jgi:hypothetical protein